MRLSPCFTLFGQLVLQGQLTYKRNDACAILVQSAPDECGFLQATPGNCPVLEGRSRQRHHKCNGLRFVIAARLDRVHVFCGRIQPMGWSS